MEVFTILSGILVFGILLYFFVSDPLSFILFGLLIAILLYVLVYFGFVRADAKPNELDITYRPSPIPSGSTVNGNGIATGNGSMPEARSILEEVFYVANNIFTYDQAESVCKAYGGELATYNQIETAYARGAEWCGYGWTAGGIALYPTQEETWRKLQLEVDPTKRIACGRPGINGGYFDPSTKFGVNCYGVRPAGKIGGDPTMAQTIDRIKAMLDKYSIGPFNKKEWSEYSAVSDRIISAEANIQGIGADIRKGKTELETSLSTVGRSTVDKTGDTFVSAYTNTRDAADRAGSSFFEYIGIDPNQISTNVESVGKSILEKMGLQTNPTSS